MSSCKRIRLESVKQATKSLIDFFARDQNVAIKKERQSKNRKNPEVRFNEFSLIKKIIPKNDKERIWKTIKQKMIEDLEKKTKFDLLHVKKKTVK